MIFVPISIALLFQDLGISVGLTSHIARYHHLELEEERKTILLAGLTFNIIVSLLVASSVFLLSPLIASDFLHRPDLELLLRVASLSIFGVALYTTANAIFIGHGRMELQSLSTVVFAVLKGILSPLLVIIGFSTFGAVLGHSISYSVTGLIGLSLVVALLRNSKGEVKVHLMLSEVGHLIRYGLPVYLSSLVSGGLNQVYNSLMVLYVVNTQIGNYSAALYFTVVVGFVTGSISIAILPAFSKLRRDDPNLGHYYRDAVKYSSFFALPIVGALIALSDPITRVVYDGGFPLSALYLQVDMLSFVYIGFGNVATSNILNGQGETRINLRCALISMLTGVPLALFLVPNYGIIGLILTLVVSPLPSVLYGLFWVKKNLLIGPDWSSGAKIFSSVFLSTLLTLLFVGVQSNLWLMLFGGATIFLVSYLVVVRVLRVLDRSDYEFFRAIVGQTGVLARLVNRIIDLID